MRGNYGVISAISADWCNWVVSMIRGKLDGFSRIVSPHSITIVSFSMSALMLLFWSRKPDLKSENSHTWAVITKNTATFFAYTCFSQQKKTPERLVKSPAHPDLAVVVPRCDASAVPGESTAPDTFMMSLQRVDALPGLAVPQLGRERHLESKPGIKDIRSVPKRMSDPR